MYALIAKDITC